MPNAFLLLFCFHGAVEQMEFYVMLHQYTVKF